jgi:hypothetical protein
MAANACGRAEQEQLLRVRRLQCGQRHCRRGIARHRLQHDRAGQRLALHGVAHHEAVFFRADARDARSRVREQPDPLQRQREQALAVDQGHELLGECLA